MDPTRSVRSPALPLAEPSTTSPAPAAGATRAAPASSGALPTRAVHADSARPRNASPGASDAPANPFSISEDDQAEEALRDSVVRDTALRGRLLASGLTVLRNAGGDDGNLCLLSALLQAAGRPLREVEERARELRGDLLSQPDDPGRALLAGVALQSDRQCLQPVADAVFSPGPVPPILVMTAGHDGRPRLFNPLWDHGQRPVELATVPHDTVVILESPGRFEFVANASGRPWSRVLERLNRSSLERIDELRDVSVDTMTPDQAQHQHHWHMPLDGALLPPALGDADSIVDEARALCAAQGVVDGVWLGLRHLQALEIGSETRQGGTRTHRLAVTIPVREQDETTLRSVSLETRANLVTGLTIEGRADGDIHVDYTAPPAPARTMIPERWPRAMLASLREHARGPDETKAHYSRRLLAEVPWADDASLAQVSDRLLSEVCNDPSINPPPVSARQQQWLQAAGTAVKRKAGEANLTYARRLKAFEPALSDGALVKGSQARLGAIERDAFIHPRALSDDQAQRLALAEAAVPRGQGSRVAYLRRLRAHDDQLGVDALVNATGMVESNVLREMRGEPAQPAALPASVPGPSTAAPGDEPIV